MNFCCRVLSRLWWKKGFFLKKKREKRGRSETHGRKCGIRWKRVMIMIWFHFVSNKQVTRESTGRRTRAKALRWRCLAATTTRWSTCCGPTTAVSPSQSATSTATRTGPSTACRIALYAPYTPSKLLPSPLFFFLYLPAYSNSLAFYNLAVTKKRNPSERTQNRTGSLCLCRGVLRPFSLSSPLLSTRPFSSQRREWMLKKERDDNKRSCVLVEERKRVRDSKRRRWLAQQPDLITTPLLFISNLWFFFSLSLSFLFRDYA